MPHINDEAAADALVEPVRLLDPYSDFLHYGNRADIELGGDRWLSWDASVPVNNTSIVTLTDVQGTVLDRVEVSWRRV